MKVTTNQQTKKYFRLGILDGLHRCYALINFLKQEENWDVILKCKQHVVLKFFVLKDMCVPDTVAKRTSMFVLFCAYSLQLMEQRKKTVDHTLWDALSICIRRVMNEKNLKYISDITVTKAKKNKSETTVHVLSSTIADRRYALNKAVLQILKDMFKYLCESDAYFECVKKHYTNQNDMTKEAFLSDIDFKKMRVSVQYIVS